MEQDTQLLTRSQVAERWGVCVHTVMRNKELKAVRFSKRSIRYRLSDVLDYEKSHSSTGVDAPIPELE
jgi:hypothetical protein